MGRSAVRMAALVTALVLAAPLPALSKDRVTVAMATFNLVNAPVLAAEQLGFFNEEGIEAVFDSAGTGSKAMASLIGGDAQVYVGTPASAFRARSKANDVVVFGAVTTQFGGSAVMSSTWARKFGLGPGTDYADKLKALKGAAVAVTSTGSTVDQVVRFLASEAGLDADRDLTITALGTADAMAAALQQGSVNIFVHGPIATENAIRNHGAVMYLNASRGDIPGLRGFFHIGLIARDGWLRKSGDLPTRFLRAVQRALDALHDPRMAPQARDAIHAAYLSDIDKAVYDLAWDATLPAFPESVAVTQPMVEFLVGFLNRYDRDPIDPKLTAKFWNGAYATKAVDSVRAAASGR